MKIEVLYVPGCPHYEPAVERLEKVLAAEAVEDEIETVAVTTLAEARALLFPGSPTVRVNGRDVEPNQALPAGLACRLYANRSGMPSEEMLQAAIAEARRKK